MQIPITTAVHAYVSLINPQLDWSLRLSATAQAMTESLRDAIAKATGLNAQAVHDLAAARRGVLAEVKLIELQGADLPDSATLAPDVERLVRAGLRVRELQRKYFKTRERDDLVASKEAEKELDTLLQRFALLLATPVQPGENDHGPR